MADDALDLVEDLVKDFGEFKKKNKAEQEKILKDASDKVAESTKEAREEAEKWYKELNDEVKKINTEIAEKGATLKQMQDEVTEFKAKGGRFRQADVEGVEPTVKLLSEAFAAEFTKIKEQANEPEAGHKFKVKAVGNMTAANNLTGNVVATYSLQPSLRGRQKLHFRDLVSVISSATGLWKFYRQNKPVGEGSFDFQTTHGAVKNQLDYDFTEVTVTVDYLAGFVRIAKQMMQDLPFMQTYVSNELVEDYLRTEDLKFFNSLTAAANGNLGDVNGTTVTIEKIIRGIAALGEDDYDVNGIVTTFSLWAKIINTKPNDYSLPGGGNAVTIASNGDVMILGIPLFKTKSAYIGADRILMGDWTKAAIIQTEGLNVNMYEQDSDNVQRNLITVKAEARVALATLRTDAFSYFGGGTT